MTQSKTDAEAVELEKFPFFADENRERAAEFFRLALQQANRHHATLLPLNISLFYFYSAGVNRQFNECLDGILATEAPWDHDTATKLFQRYFSPCQDISLAELQKELLSVVDSAISTVTSASSRAGKHSETLDRQVVRMSTCGDPRETLKIAAEVLREARAMSAESDTLASELRESAGEITRLKDELSMARKEALLDSLTGLPNRRVFDTALDEMIQRDRPFTLIMLDIDHFKEINDQHGHLIGDQVLKQVAKVVTQSARHNDTVTRFGGEEFAVLLPNTPIADARRVAEQMRGNVERIRMRRRDTGASIGTITASFGVAEYHRGNNGEGLVSSADDALYSAKRNGRNRVEFAH